PRREIALPLQPQWPLPEKFFSAWESSAKLISRVILDDPASSWPLLALGARFGQGGFIAKVWRQLTANRAGAGVSACLVALRLSKGKSHTNYNDPPGAGGATDTPRIPDLSIAWATSPEAFTSSMNSRRYLAATSRPFGVPSACWLAMNRPSSTRDPGSLWALATRCCLMPATTSTLPAR